MNKILASIKRILLFFVVIAIVNGVVNYFFLWENDGGKYYEQYIKESQQIKVHVVNKKDFEDKFGYTSYLKHTLYFKGVMGGSEDYTFEDGYTHKYFKVMRFDQYGEEYSYPQTREITDKDLYVMANTYELNNPLYGTVKNPILVFSYKGVEKQVVIGVGNGERLSLEPSEEEYKYNVLNYLTYVMPREEFKKRF